MSQENHPSDQNWILDALGPDGIERLHRHLTPISLARGTTLYEPDQRIKQVYFVDSGAVSFVARLEDGGSVEVGFVGREGFVGIPILLGDDRSPDHAIVQLAGTGRRLDAAVFKAELAVNERLKKMALSFTLAMAKQVSQTAACNGSHTVAKRLARWLLMSHDRVDGPVIELTQEFIAQMLGSRRSGVGEVAITLQTEQLITYIRGRITIIDRKGLEKFTCECYEVVRSEYDRLLKYQA